MPSNNRESFRKRAKEAIASIMRASTLGQVAVQGDEPLYNPTLSAETDIVQVDPLVEDSPLSGHSPAEASPDSTD